MTDVVAQTSASQTSTAPLALRVAALQDRLLHITARNRSIMLGPLSGTLDLATLGRCDEAVRRLLRGTGSVMLVSDARSDDEAAASRRQAAALARNLRHQYDETGLRHGHVGFPFLEGALDDDSWVRGPLVLIPVRLWHAEGRHPGWRVELREGARPTANRALLAAIAKIRDVRIGDAFQDDLEEFLERHGQLTAADWDLAALLTDLEDLLAQHGVSAPLDATTPVPIAPRNKEQRLAEMDTPLHLAPHVVLADFPQTNEPIHADYSALIDAAIGGDEDTTLVSHLLDDPIRALPEATPPALDDVADADLGTVLPSNGRQDEILLRARSAPCTVIRGPPGTGKSQVITNLVSDALRHGERVLVVCQKRAALNVVHDRLAQAGLDDLALLVHDANADRKDAFRRLEHLLDGARPTGPDTETVCAEVDALVGELDALTERFGRVHRGLPIHAIYSDADPDYEPRIGHESRLRQVVWDDIEKSVRAVEVLGDDVRRYRLDHAWRYRRSLASDAPRRSDAEHAVEALITALEGDYHIDDRKRLEAMHAAFSVWHATRRRWWRMLDPRFLQAQATIAAFLDEQDVPMGEAAAWARRVRHGIGILDALDGIPALSQRMRRHITHAGPDQARQTAQAWHAGLADWDHLIQVDKEMASLDPAVRRLCILAIDRLDHPASLRQEALHAWIDELEEDPDMQGDAFQAYERRRARLADVLERRRGLVAGAIHDAQLAVARSPPAIPGDPTAGRRDHHQALALLRRKRRIPTLRQLIQDPRFGIVWHRSARCWLMSPEAVSAVHPFEPGLFDVVIFDEASQLAVERALPAIYRAKRIVIAGDEQQLPPFDLFHGHADDDTPADSLLSLGRAAFGCHMLEWHYRSEYQALVEFSNQAYYEGGLKVVPNPAVQARPIRYHRVDGRFIDRQNPVEAGAVVDLLDDLLRAEDPSIGVVTFNKAQRDLIEEMIEARAAEDPDFRRQWNRACAGEEAPFVKNIENVQGDERDIILFSTTYGPDADGRVQQRFGVFNTLGGEHRLNVAITRARTQVHVVTSLDPEQLDVENSQHLGPKHLKAYLAYARAVDAGDDETADRILASVRDAPEVTGRRPTPSRLHDSLVRALAAEGLQAATLVGYSGYRIDVAVAHPDDPDRYVVAVELDGEHFRDARGARERDVARQAFLASRGWRVERVWSRNWFRDPDGEAARIAATVHRA